MIIVYSAECFATQTRGRGTGIVATKALWGASRKTYLCVVKNSCNNYNNDDNDYNDDNNNNNDKSGGEGSSKYIKKNNKNNNDNR